MSKNTLLAFILSAIVLFTFQYFFAPKKPINPQAEQTTQKAASNNQQTESAAAEAEPIKLENNKVEYESEVLETFDVQTELAKYVFNSNTGNIRKVDVLKYNGRELNDISFDSKKTDSIFTEVPLISKFSSTVSKNNGTTTVTFEGSQGDLVVTKKYEINEGSYLVKGSMIMTNVGERTISVPFKSGFAAGIVNGFESDRFTFQGPLMFDGKRLKSVKESKVEEPVVVNNPLWVGYSSKYFFTGIAQTYKAGTITKSGESATIAGETDVKLNPGDRQEVGFNVYAGPKEYEGLKALDMKFEKSLDFGVFSFIAIPMLKFLNMINDVVKNYGIAIILLTIAIKILTFPLTQKSMVSMKKMSSLQPKMQELKEKLGEDKQKLQAATMELYKKEGVNPFGGCLPMLLQIPIFFALYKALLLSIELQGAPFFGWITDLSVKDPYYITPVLMGVTMFLQQKMTPATSADPTQQKIFQFMPVIFTFLFLTFPSGLVVYWLTNNVLTIAQQYLINKKLA
jgi:YidC/Oxa1 family membrane protein insertase